MTIADKLAALRVELETAQARIAELEAERWERNSRITAERERMDVLVEKLTEERDRSSAWVTQLQKALAFWHPGVGGREDDEFLTHAGDDAMLLFGYLGENEPSAIERGWIKVIPDEGAEHERD